jgi:hypothetical protein
MNIGIFDTDSHNGFPNIALMKLSAFHKKHGDIVHFNNYFLQYDKAYVSKIFTFSQVPQTPIQANEVICGGVGWLNKERACPINTLGKYLRELPTEVNDCYPDYGLYGVTNIAYGHLTRGCPRNCPWCVVPSQEGTISRHVSKLSRFWDEQRNITLMDANLLACPEKSILLDELAGSGAWIDFTQGLDIRYCDLQTIEALNHIKVKRFHFAWDNPKKDLSHYFYNFKEHSKIKDPSRLIVYVLVGFNSTIEEDLHRIYTLRKLGFNPDVRIYNKHLLPKGHELLKLQRWCNNRRIFYSEPDFRKYNHRGTTA